MFIFRLKFILLPLLVLSLLVVSCGDEGLDGPSESLSCNVDVSHKCYFSIDHQTLDARCHFAGGVVVDSCTANNLTGTCKFNYDYDESITVHYYEPWYTIQTASIECSNENGVFTGM